MLILDVVWPAIYVAAEFWKFWFLVIGTIVLEAIVLKEFLHFSWLKASLMSLVGNLISGIIGTFIMLFAMIGWHYAADWFIPGGTFDRINWVATFVLMCLGSVLIEVIAVRLIFKEPIRRLFVPMMLGNVLSYSLIAYVMATKPDPNKDPDEVRRETLRYLPLRNEYTLYGGSKVWIDTGKMDIMYDKAGQVLNDRLKNGYILKVPFRKQDTLEFLFTITLLDERSEGMQNHVQSFLLRQASDTVKLELEQKNPDTSIGWRKGIVTDTVLMVKQHDH